MSALPQTWCDPPPGDGKHKRPVAKAIQVERSSVRPGNKAEEKEEGPDQRLLPKEIHGSWLQRTAQSRGTLGECDVLPRGTVPRARRPTRVRTAAAAEEMPRGGGGGQAGTLTGRP